jgi:SAM-dependent methyltransferase
MATLLETPDRCPDRIIAQYAQGFPQDAAPATGDELVSGKLHIFRRFFSPLLPAHKDAAILDIGCGYGSFLYFLQQKGYTNTQGIDASALRVEVGNSLGVRNIRCGDVRDFLARARQPFKFISAINVLDHIPTEQILDFLAQVRSALAPGGTFLCQVPNLAAFFSPHFHKDFSQESPFTAASLNRALTLAGFSGVKVSGMNTFHHGAKGALRHFLWKGISAGLRFVRIVEGGPRDPLDSIYTSAIYATCERS